MRGKSDNQLKLFYSINIEERIPQSHPIRKIKPFVDSVLKDISSELDKIYSKVGRPSIPPEQLLKSTILIALYSIRSDRLFCEMLDYNMLFRWFLDMDIEVKSFDHSTFSKNRERMIDNTISKKFFYRIVNKLRDQDYLSEDHFSVDGTLIESWASIKSFKEKDDKKNKTPGGRNSYNDFSGKKLTNDTHESTTDPEAKLMRKSFGTTAKLSYTANVIMENRNGFCVEAQIDKANTKAERDSAVKMINKLFQRKYFFKSLGADKGYHTKDFIKFLRNKYIIPHVATRKGWNLLGLDKRTTHSRGYEISTRKRKKIEEIFGWLKTVGLFRKAKLVGMEKLNDHLFMLVSAFNLRRLAG